MLVIKKHGKDVSRKGSFDSGIGMQVLVLLRTPSFEDFFFCFCCFAKRKLGEVRFILPFLIVIMISQAAGILSNMTKQFWELL